MDVGRRGRRRYRRGADVSSPAMPVSLFMSGRSLCPQCGAPITLGSDQLSATCRWCGSRAHVERRLRSVEPKVAGGFEPTAVAVPDGGWVPSHWGSGDHGRPRCPGCGSPFETDLAQEIRQCPHCGSHSKIERRLAFSDEGAPADYREPRHRFALSRVLRQRRDRARDLLAARVLVETDLDPSRFWSHPRRESTTIEQRDASVRRQTQTYLK